MRWPTIQALQACIDRHGWPVRFGLFCVACAAELEAPPALISELEAGGGLVIFAMNPSGMTVAHPISLIGFAKALAGSRAEAGAREVPARPIGWAGPDWQPIGGWKR